jgi:SAM-dependent methyltransferase
MAERVHALRERAELFGKEAERYDRSRPSYPEALIDEVLGSSPQGLSVLDVACGTGIASRQMAERGARVLGVDLNAGMVEIAERHGIVAEVAAFEKWDPAGRTFDRVVCAQAWHWLDPEASLEKAASVLRANGRLCLFWNVGHYPDDLADALLATYRRALPPEALTTVVGYAANRANDATPDFGAVFTGLRARDNFTKVEVKSFPWSRDYTRDLWLDELHSHSDHAALTPKVKQRLFDQVGKTIDAFGGSFRMSYVSTLIATTRK